MENASKALILAGSILIALILISLGIIAFRNMSQSVENNSGLDQQKIASFNERFIKFVGNNISGTDVNDLIQRVISTNNIALRDSDTIKRIQITRYDGKKIYINASNSLVREFSNVPTGTYYNVNCTYSEYGLISEITISK